MSTGHVNHLLSDYLEGSIAKANADKIKSHLVFCNNCRHTLHDFEKNRKTLADLPVIAVPADLEQKILAQLKSQPALSAAETTAPSEPINWGPILKIGGVLGAIALIILIVKNLPARAPQEEAPTVEASAAEAPVVAEAAPAVEAPVQPAPPVAEAPVQPKTAPEPLTPAPAAPVLTGDGTVNINGTFSGIDTSQETVLKNEKGWKNLWKNHVKKIEPAPPLPAVNFETHDIIAVFSGSQSSGGYAVEITKIEETTWEGSPARIVHYRTSEPPSGGMNTMALTQPHHIKTTPKLIGRTFFRKNR